MSRTKHQRKPRGKCRGVKHRDNAQHHMTPLDHPVPARDLRALSLDDANLDAAWQGALDEIRAEGRVPDAVVRRAGEVLTAWHATPHATGDLRR